MLLALKPLMLQESPNCFSTLSSNGLDYMTLSSLTKAHNLPLPSPKNSPTYSNIMFASPLHIILRPMVKLSEPIKSLRHISTSFVPKTRLNGYSSSPLWNSTTTLPHIALLRCHHFPYFMAMNPTLTPLWERCSFLPLKND